MADELTTYYRDVVLPCKGFNLWNYMSCTRVQHWDFAKIREELDRLEHAVKAHTAVHQ
jgi:hypothetical protein